MLEAVPKYPVPETVSAVDEAYGNTLVNDELLLKMPSAVKLPVRYPAPETANSAPGVEVAIPTLPELLMMVRAERVVVAVPATVVVAM